MASSSADSPVVDLQAISDAQAWNYGDIAAVVVILYDTLLSLSDEVELVWCKKLSLGSVLYILARYGTLIQVLMNISLDTANVSIQTCNTLVVTGNTMFILSGFGISGLLLARAYAVSSRQRIMMSILFSLFIMNQTVTFIAAYRHPNCESEQDSTDHILDIFNSVGTIIFDAGIVVSAIHHIRLVWKDLAFIRSRDSFTTLFVKQGIYRFAIIAVWNLTDIIVEKVARSTISGMDICAENVISAILMCRFLLQLRKFHLTPGESLSKSSFVPVRHTTTIKSFITSMDEAVVTEFGNQAMNTSSSLSSTDVELESFGGKSTLVNHESTLCHSPISPWTTKHCGTPDRDLAGRQQIFP